MNSPGDSPRDFRPPRARDDGPDDASLPLPWSHAPDELAPQDLDGAALTEGWSALDQLIRGAQLSRFDSAAQSRLVRAVERRTRRRALVGWGTALAAAAAALLILTIRRDGVDPIAVDGPQPAPRDAAPAPGSQVADSNTGNSSTAGSQTADLPASDSETVKLAAEFWSDDFAADLESARVQAREVELSWRRDSEPLADLRQRFDELQADWNDRSL